MIEEADVRIFKLEHRVEVISKVLLELSQVTLNPSNSDAVKAALFPRGEILTPKCAHTLIIYDKPGDDPRSGLCSDCGILMEKVFVEKWRPK